jgi:hypothetical protein
MFNKMIKYAASDRNKQPILGELVKYIKVGTFALEIASGTGQHITHFAMHFTRVKFQPTEIEEELLHSIRSYIEQNELTNVLQPAYLDVRDDPNTWMDGKLTPSSVDYVLNSNMIHISAFEVCEGISKI